MNTQKQQETTSHKDWHFMNHRRRAETEIKMTKKTTTKVSQQQQSIIDQCELYSVSFSREFKWRYCTEIPHKNEFNDSKDTTSKKKSLSMIQEKESDTAMKQKQSIQVRSKTLPQLIQLYNKYTQKYSAMFAQNWEMQNILESQSILRMVIIFDWQTTSSKTFISTIKTSCIKNLVCTNKTNYIT